MSADAKIEYILSSQKRDPLAVDVQFSYFVAALTSYRHDTVLKPFPSAYCENDNPEQKNYVKLKKDVSCFQKITKVTQQSLKSVQSDVVDLMYWILHSNKFCLRSCSKDKFSVIEALTGQLTSVPPPNFVFEVIYNESVEEKFNELKGDKDLFYAYHGSRVENFYSILAHGLQQNMTKNALFGEGIYLSSELSVSLPYAPTGSGWDSSIIGQKLSCIAVCQIIDDPTRVKCQEKVADKTNSSTPSRSHIAGSMGGEVPEKYYVVRNNDLVRVKYLLVYAQSSPSESVKRSWIYQHKFTVMMIFYALVLLLVGLYNSRSFSIYIKKWLKKL